MITKLIIIQILKKRKKIKLLENAARDKNISLQGKFFNLPFIALL